MGSEPRKRRTYFFDDWDVDIGHTNVIIAKSKTQYTRSELFAKGYAVCEKALDIFTAEGFGAHSIIEPHHRRIELIFENDQYSLYIDDIDNLSIDVDLQVTVVDKNGNKIPTPPVPQPSWESIFRYYRFSQTSNNMYDAYRWMYLVFEILMQTIAPIKLRTNGKPSEQEKGWIDRALRLADTKYNWSAHVNWIVNDPVGYFLSNQYDNVRCNLFHSKGGKILPNDNLDSQLVYEMLLQLERLCHYLMSRLYPIRKNRGVITDQGFNLITKAGFQDTTAFINNNPVNLYQATGEGALVSPLLILKADENAIAGPQGIAECKYSAQISPHSKYAVRSYGLNKGKDVLIIGNFGDTPLSIEGIHYLSISFHLRLMNRGDAKYYT